MHLGAQSHFKNHKLCHTPRQTKSPNTASTDPSKTSRMIQTK